MWHNSTNQKQTGHIMDRQKIIRSALTRFPSHSPHAIEAIAHFVCDSIAMQRADGSGPEFRFDSAETKMTPAQRLDAAKAELQNMWKGTNAQIAPPESAREAADSALDAIQNAWRRP